MYTLHIGNKNYSSWSLRPWVLLTTLGIPFYEAFHAFPPEGSYKSFRKFSPTGLVPVLEDGSQRVWESLSIVEYVAEAHPEVWPADKTARAWARSAASEMHGGFSALRNYCGMNVGVRAKLKSYPEALKKNVDRLDELWTEGLTRFGGPFLAADKFTAVDAFFCPVAFRIRTYGLQLSPAAMAYYERLLALPSMRAWEAAALAEDFRDWPHDNEQLGYADFTADYRAAEKV